MRIQERGAAIVETAFASSFLLCYMFGSLSLATIGYYQLASDDASFRVAHANAVASSSKNTKSVDTSQLSQMNTLTKDEPSVNTSLPPVNYHYGSTTGRHGGVATLQAPQLESLISGSGSVSLAGLLAYIQGTYSEPVPREYGSLYNIAGATSFSGLNAHAVNFFTSPDDAPPYFVALADMAQCATPSPWDCCLNVSFRTLGLAEELDDMNWNRSVPGVAPKPTALFWETLYHQQQFANFSHSVSAYSTRSAAAKSGIFSVTKNHTLKTIYGWDAVPPSGGSIPLSSAQPNPSL